MDKRKTLLLLLPLVLVMVMANAVLALDASAELVGITLITPAANAVISSDYKLDAEMDGEINGTSNESLYNFSYQVYSGSTANSSYTTICWLTDINLTTNATKDKALNCTHYNGTRYGGVAATSTGIINVSLVEDAKDYYVRVIAVQSNNSANTVTSPVVSGVTIDYQIPDTPSAIQPPSGSRLNDTDDVRINATVNGAENTNCTLLWKDTTPTGNREEIMTESSNTCYVSLTGIPDGTYQYKINSTDGTNSTLTDWYTLIVDLGLASPAAKAYILDSERVQDTGFGKSDSAKFALIAILGVLIYVAANRNKT